MKLRKIVALTVVMSAFAISNGALAYDAGDILIRVGATTVSPNESSSQVILQPNTAVGKVSVDDNTQLGLNFAYLLTPHVGVELLAATPFNHKIKGSSGLINNLDIGSTKQLPPTLSVIYYPLKSDFFFQPYLGVGVNYTRFFDEDTSSSLESFLGSEGSLTLDDSWGLAGQVGADYILDDHWFLNASMRYIDIDTTAHIKMNNGARLHADVDIDPWVSTFSVGYKF